jgi:hypothetical protein
MGHKKKIKKAAKIKKPIKKGKTLTLLNLKVTDNEHTILDRNAKKHASGNLSAWLRHAGRHYKPKRGEIIR